MRKFVMMLLGLSFLAVFLGFNSNVVLAEGAYDIKEMTPEVKSALEGRRNRFDQLRELKAKGAIGENNRGYVEVIGDGAGAQSVVDAENSDRRLIYKTIEQQNDLSNALGTIEKVFAQVQRDKASPGDKIQDESGNWTAK